MTPRSSARTGGKDAPRVNKVALVLVALILAGLAAGTIGLVAGGGTTPEPPVGPDVTSGP